MELNPLTAVSPIDGRYRRKCERFSGYFSEFAIIRYRIQIEIEYFIALSEWGIPRTASLDEDRKAELRRIYRYFEEGEAEKVKALERETNHDVKAVEYYVKDKLKEMGLSEDREFVHFGLTSQDINNTAFPLALKEAFENELNPSYLEVIEELNQASQDWQDIPMLARTHGQPASPTLLGKEIRVFAERLELQMAYFERIPFSAKFGGATGNFNAHYLAFPNVDWPAFADDLVRNKLGLERSRTTTQIEHYDNLGAFFHNLERLNTILIDLARDLWTYISRDLFKQRAEKDEVGSSAMPHKVNPIDLENAEGNLGLANSSFHHLASKLPISRLQRDLTDSTVIRNIGVPIAHTALALDSLKKGMGKLQPELSAFQDELDANWSVLSEAIQTVLRREGFPDPYETIKKLTRDKGKLDRDAVHRIIEELEVEERVKEELRELTPSSYTGQAPSSGGSN